MNNENNIEETNHSSASVKNRASDITGKNNPVNGLEIESEINGISPSSSWPDRLISMATTFLIVVVIVFYHFAMVNNNKQRYAVADIAEILNIKELQVTIAAMSPDSTEEMRAEAFNEVARFGKGLETVLNDLQQECGCSIFVKAAVIKPAAAEDLTQEIKRRMGLENVTSNDLAQQLRRVGGAGSAPLLGGAIK